MVEISSKDAMPAEGSSRQPVRHDALAVSKLLDGDDSQKPNGKQANTHRFMGQVTDSLADRCNSVARSEKRVPAIVQDNVEGVSMPENTDGNKSNLTDAIGKQIEDNCKFFA